MKVHGQHPVCTGGHDHVGHQLGGDGVPTLGFPVLTGIAKVRHDGGDPPGRGPAESVHHNEQLHQIVVNRVAGGLHHKHVTSADCLIDGYGDFAVSELFDLATAQGQAQLVANSLCKGGVGVAAEYLDFFTMCNHRKVPLFNFSYLESGNPEYLTFCGGWPTLFCWSGGCGPHPRLRPVHPG